VSGGEPRTLAPPERRRTEVTANERIGAYSLINALDPHGPGEPRPGQFYMLASAERWGGGEGERPYLPRAFSYARARLGPGGVELSFLLEDVGPGTHRLGQLRPGDGLNVLGPLGIGFTPPRDGRRAVLCGGGIGAAPLLCWQEELSGATEVLLGFRSAAHAEGASLFAGAPTVVTDDGSVGRQALVTEPLRGTLTDDPRAAVYACGPPAMLEGVRALCGELEVPAQLAMESGMACGFGACFGCVVATREGFVRLCVDGPVLDAASLETALTPGAGH
jgi:NAD(P)H-flavin reductase